ncbi:cobalamin-binding protein [Amycolatopsis sp. K13G38]|uniref:Cobalamin-binding protein n=1 Tax=Amycolatopsis acididurans TaxID=2724524 RepID=A0ABX1JIF0_9PSEU|nr:cobalamin-dependent protein [Amycolatopsis acididurans]NKQ58614.1 cobalamin-binding protein [Amycolatopsis acididurans]
MTTTDSYRARLWDAVIEADEYTAGEVVLDALERGMNEEILLLDVVGAVQREIGEEWAANRISVAQEHLASAINDRIVGRLAYSHAPVRARNGRVAIACLDGEWHALPARLLAEVLKLRGFRVDFLGAHVPTPHLIGHLHRTGPDWVALSASLATRLPTAHATISACQAAGVPVIAGGAAFGPEGRYAGLLGADAWAPDARAAADRLHGERPSVRVGAGEPIADLPHLTDQEYTMVTRGAGELVKAMYVGLEEQLPSVREYTEQQRQYTLEDLAHIVDFFAAALYTGDDELFHRFLAWTAGVLEARRVPAAFLLPGLDLLGGQLLELPRAAGLADRARARLAAALAGPGEDR